MAKPEQEVGDQRGLMYAIDCFASFPSLQIWLYGKAVI